MAFFLTPGQASAKDERPWEVPASPAWFEKWIAEATSRLIRYNGRQYQRPQALGHQ
jgi:hypothetical protein